MQSSPRTQVVVVLAAAVLAVSIGFAVRLDAPPVADTASRTAATPVPARARARRSLPADVPAPAADATNAPLPASLRATESDGWLGVDDDGHLVVTPGARWFFDYYLSAAGEEPPEDLHRRIVSEIERRLPPAGAREAIALLDRYLAYRERVRDAEEKGSTADLSQRLAALHQIRIETFGTSDAAILFGEEEQVHAADLRRRAVITDTTLSPAERERQLHEIEQQLPPAVRAARADSFAPLHLMQDEQALRDAGGSPTEIQALRTQRFGADAAERLAALDREQATWRQRVDDYQHARGVIEADTTLSEAARAQALDALITHRFTQQERLRVDAQSQVAPRVD